jgi:chemotaxis protein MotB
MSEHEHANLRPIIKRIKKVKAKHHGGAWKIAYADFVTAMMAFFLLMWLLSLLNKYQLQGVSSYFKKPLKEAFTQQDSTTHKATKKPIVTGDLADKSIGAKQEPQTSSEAMQAMKEALETKLNDDPKMQQYKNQLNFVVTADGLKIELHDMENKPMFSQGKTDFQEHAKKILSWLSNELNTYPNQVEIIGHTDSQPYAGTPSYSNWELSTDRANATRRSLVDNGMSPQKIIRIIGVADTELLNKSDSYDASNRRIEIVVLTDESRKKLLEQ